MNNDDSICSPTPSSDIASISDVPKPLLPSSKYPKRLHPSKGNINSTIFFFLRALNRPNITPYAALALVAWKRAQVLEFPRLRKQRRKYSCLVGNAINM